MTGAFLPQICHKFLSHNFQILLPSADSLYLVLVQHAEIIVGLAETGRSNREKQARRHKTEMRNANQ